MNRYNITEYPYHLDSEGFWMKYSDHLIEMENERSCGNMYKDMEALANVRIRKLQAEKNNLKAILSGRNIRIEQLDSDLRDWKAESIRQKDVINEREESRITLEELEKLQHELENEKNHHGQLRCEQMVMQHDNAKLKEENERLVDRGMKRNGEIMRLKESIDIWHNKCEEQKKKMLKAHRDLDPDA